MLATHVAGDRYAFEELFYRHHCPLRTLLADLQAGLLDDGTAPDVPAEVTARVGAVSQAAPPHQGPPREPAHSVRHTPRWQLIGLAAGVGAAVVGVVLGGVMLVREPAPTRSAG